MSLIGNRYEILNFDGNIELNKIYEARDAYDNIKVLIKVIEHNKNICSDFISNLIDENTMINQLNSPYILKTIDIGEHCTEFTTFYYIVSEYYEGISLKNLILGNYIHLEAIVNMSTQILKALEVIHNNSYHGDLNPKNIIVDGNYNIKIFGFGITKANQGINIRSYNEVKYLSPHQLCINYTDKESDYFSLGIILFESIFKKMPFGESNNDEEMLKLIDKGIEFKNLKAINGNYKLIEIIKKLLNRKDKYNNTKEIIIDLSHVMYDKADIDDIKVCKLDVVNKRINSKFLVAASMLIIISMMIFSMI